MKKSFEVNEQNSLTSSVSLFSYDRPKRLDNFSSSLFDVHQTESPPVSARDDFSDSYKMAAEVAVGAAIVIALAILLALIWNQLKRQLPDAGESSAGRRYSLDSFERVVENRLRDRPPAYSPDQDKPPSYEESFNDFSRLPSFSEVREERSIRHDGSATQLLNSNNASPAYRSSPAHDNPISPAANHPPVHDCTSQLYRASNLNFSHVDTTENNDSVFERIPSISMIVQQDNVVTESGSDDEVIMLHL